MSAKQAEQIAELEEIIRIYQLLEKGEKIPYNPETAYQIYIDRYSKKGKK